MYKDKIKTGTNMKPIRIAYLSDSDVPSFRANTVHVLKMCSALSKRGADVTLFCNRNKGYVEEKIYDAYNLTSHFNICAFKSVLSGKFRILECAIKKAIAVSKCQFDCCYGRSLLALLLIPKKSCFVYESHILPERGLFLFLEKKLLKNRKCLKLVVISQSLKDAHLRAFPFLKDEDVMVLHDGADVHDGLVKNYAVAKDLIAAHENGITIGYIGHLYPGKCMELMIQIAQKMPEQIFHVIGGTDEWVNHWRSICQETGVCNIRLYGYIDNSVVNAYYQHLDIVLLPFSDKVFFSKNKKDDIGKYISPLKLFEAMACGKAIIASKLISIEEVIQNGKDGILVQPSDIDSWCLSIRELIGNPEKRLYLSNNAKEKLEKHYSWLKRAENIIKIFEK